MTAITRKPQERGVRSRARILETAQQLMATRGYAGTSISAICKETGLPATSIYHHFGSKQQLLAAVMERGAQQWFASLPGWGEVPYPSADTAQFDSPVVDAADAVADNPLFLRLFYMLSLDGETDSDAAKLVQEVRGSAFRYFETALTQLLSADYPADVARGVATRLTPFAVAQSDGCFFSLQLESDRAGVRQMFADLVLAVRAMAPHIAGTLTSPETKE
jgi:AcrR family transcriptional regulator